MPKIVRSLRELGAAITPTSPKTTKTTRSPEEWAALQASFRQVDQMPTIPVVTPEQLALLDRVNRERSEWAYAEADHTLYPDTSGPKSIHQSVRPGRLQFVKPNRRSGPIKPDPRFVETSRYCGRGNPLPSQGSF